MSGCKRDSCGWLYQTAERLSRKRTDHWPSSMLLLSDGQQESLCGMCHFKDRLVRNLEVVCERQSDSWLQTVRWFLTVNFTSMAMMHTTLNMLHNKDKASTWKMLCLLPTDFTNRYNAQTSSILCRAGVSTIQMANTHLFPFPWQDHKKISLSIPI